MFAMLQNSKASGLMLEESVPQEVTGSGMLSEVTASLGRLRGSETMPTLGLKLLPAQLITWMSFLKVLKEIRRDRNRGYKWCVRHR